MELEVSSTDQFLEATTIPGQKDSLFARSKKTKTAFETTRRLPMPAKCVRGTVCFTFGTRSMGELTNMDSGLIYPWEIYQYADKIAQLNHFHHFPRPDNDLSYQELGEFLDKYPIVWINTTGHIIGVIKITNPELGHQYAVFNSNPDFDLLPDIIDKLPKKPLIYSPWLTLCELELIDILVKNLHKKSHEPIHLHGFRPLNQKQ